MVFKKNLVDVDICFELERFLDPQMKIWIKLIKTKNKEKKRKQEYFLPEGHYCFQIKKNTEKKL